MGSSNVNPIYQMAGVASMGTANATNTNLESRVTRLESIAPYQLRGGSFTPVTYTPLLAAAVSNSGQINLSSAGGFVFQGSMAPNVIDGQFSVGASSTTTAQIYWDGTNSSRVILIRRADGTVSPVPPSHINVTGLTASTKYIYMAYWAPDNQCGIGFAQGDTGTPEIAFSPSATATALNQGAVQQTLAGREKLGTFSFTQPSSGSSSPGNPSPTPPINPGMCVMQGTDIEPLGDIGPNDWRIEMAPHSDWYRLETLRGLHLCCTPTHPLYTDNGKTQVQRLKAGDWVITKLGMEKVTDITPFIRGCTLKSPRMNHGHLYWANGFLSSNAKNQPDQS